MAASRGEKRTLLSRMPRFEDTWETQQLAELSFPRRLIAGITRSPVVALLILMTSLSMAYCPLGGHSHFLSTFEKRAITVCVAVAGAIINAILAFAGINNSLEMQKERFKSDVILEVIKSGDSLSSCRNLKYVLDLNLIEDSKGVIEKVCKTPENGPALPKPGAKNVTTGLLSLLRAARDAAGNGDAGQALNLYEKAAAQSRTNSAVDQIALRQADEALGRKDFTDALSKFDSAFVKLHTPVE